MIDDLIKRFAFGGNLDRDEIQELINEIERLNLELVAARPLYSRRQLEEENEGLRQELDAIRVYAAEGFSGKTAYFWRIAEMAQQALKGGSTDEKQSELPGDGQ